MFKKAPEQGEDSGSSGKSWIIFLGKVRKFLVHERFGI